MNKPGACSLLSFFAAFSINSLLAIAEEQPASGKISLAGHNYTFRIDVCHSINSGESSDFMLGGSAQGSDGSMAGQGSLDQLHIISAPEMDLPETSP